LTGNLRTYPTGGSIPTASVVTYTGGVSIASGTITASCTACTDELTVRNQGAGTTHVVVDVTGYFVAPEATRLGCQTAVADVSLAAGVGSTGIATATCPTGYAPTGGGGYEGTSGATILISKVDIGGSYVYCRLVNNTSSAVTAECQARCCRVPGR
jgi:hypothetical protein